MNERIRELFEQAHIQPPRVVAEFIQWTPPKQFSLEKFAELIVEECINRIEQNRSSGENTDSWTITRDMAFHQMKEDLKRHFGVEE